jgi:hypothetical protein
LIFDQAGVKDVIAHPFDDHGDGPGKSDTVVSSGRFRE